MILWHMILYYVILSMCHYTYMYIYIYIYIYEHICIYIYIYIHTQGAVGRAPEQGDPRACLQGRDSPGSRRHMCLFYTSCCFIRVCVCTRHHIYICIYIYIYIYRAWHTYDGTPTTAWSLQGGGGASPRWTSWDVSGSPRCSLADTSARPAFHRCKQQAMCGRFADLRFRKLQSRVWTDLRF